MGSMKAGTEDEKAMRPMFPRLHVNDTDKGGPRAPPRNKMALYEQLSIPLQRFNSTTFPTHKTGNLAPSVSSCQGDAPQKTPYSPLYLPHSMPAHAEKPYYQTLEGKNIKIRRMEFEGRSAGHVDYKSSHDAGLGTEGISFSTNGLSSGKDTFKIKNDDDDDDDDDFRVPTFVQSEIAPHSKVTSVLKVNRPAPHLMDAPLVKVNKPAPFSASSLQNSTTLNSSIQVLSSSSQPILGAHASGTMSTKHERIHYEQESRETVLHREHGHLPTNPEAGEILADPSKFSLAISDHAAEINTIFLEKKGVLGKKSSHNGSTEGLRFINDQECLESRNASKVGSRSCSWGSPENSHASYADKANGSGESKDADKNGEVSEASMVDSGSGSEVSPDDVVGVIGAKQFWKARRAIVNQQRVFAIQVFELHRLIRVQKLFAASPHLLLDDSHIIKFQPKVSTKSLPVSSNLKFQQVVQQSGDSSQKPRQNADHLLEKTAVPPLQTQERGSIKDLGQLHRCVPHSEIQTPILSASDNRSNPRGFHPPANQWLIPVMSPSEGLIYKPYAGLCPPTPGFMAPLYGSCGPLTMPSVAGDFMNTPSGGPASHHPQNMGVLPGSPAVGPNYFQAPFGMPVVNPVISASAVEQVSPVKSARPNGRSVQHSWSSCNMSITRSEALSGCPPKQNASKDSELQGSSASSPCNRAQGEVRDVLPLFPVAPAAEGSSQPSQSSGRVHPHVIKVVPHNARSATESAARIFRSIQEERQQLDL